MADINELFSALQKADAAGNVDDARQIAGMIRQVGGYSMPEAPAVKPDTGLTGAFKAGKENILADFERLKGKTGFKDVAEAEAAAKAHETKAGQIFKPTEEGWTEAPWQKFKETLGGSLPYMAAPVAAGLGALALPEALGAGAITAAGMGLSGLASGVQFTGSNLSRQVKEGKSLEEASLLEAGAAAVPQAALDVIGLRMIPGIRGIFGKAGLEITEEQAAKLAQRGLLEKAGSVALQTGKTMGTEGLTETGQQVLERLQAGLSITDPQARQEYFDSFIGGAVLGGTLGTVGQAFEGKKVIPNAPPPPPPQVDSSGQLSLGLEGGVETAGPRLTSPTETDSTQAIAQIRDQYDTIEREMDRLKEAYATVQDPKEKEAILVQAQKLDFARQELEGQLEGAPARQTAPEAQGALDFEQPYPKSRLQAEPTIIGQEAAAPAVQPNLDLEFAKQRLAAGAPLTPAQELMVRQDQAAQRVALQNAPAPKLEIPNVVGANARPTSYVVDDAAIDTFGITKGATKFRKAIRGLDLMNPEDAAKFDKLVEQHERKNAKINMDAVEAFRSEKPEPVAAREVPEREPLPARPYDARKAFQQARETQFAFGQVGSPLSPRDVRAQKRAEYDGRTGTGNVGGGDERSVQLSSTGIPTTEGTTTPTPTRVGSAVGTANQPDGRTAARGETGTAALKQMAQQVAPPTAPKIKQEKVKRVETKEALEDQLAKEAVDPETEQLLKDLGIEPAERKPTTYRVAATDSPGLTKERVENIVKAVTAKWKNAPEIRTVQSEMQLPQSIQDQIKRDGVRRPEGVWSDQDNCVFLIAGNIANAQNAVLTIAHETVGHFGIRGILGDTYLATMNRIYEGNPEVKALADNKIDRGMDPATAVEEVLAEFAENTPNPTVMQRIINLIRQAFAKVGFPLSGVSNGEIQQLLKDARNFVIEGKGGAKNTGTKIGQVYSADGPLFYSRLGAMVQHAPKELSKGATSAQWATWIKSNAGKFGVKAEELEWTGVEDVLALMDKGTKLTTQDVAKMVADTGVKVDEIVRTEPRIDTAKIDEIQTQRGQLNIDRKELEKEQIKLASEINSKKLLVDDEYTRFNIEKIKEDSGETRTSKAIVLGIGTHIFHEDNFKPGEGQKLYNDIIDRQIEINKIWKKQSELHGLIGRIENEAGEDERRFGGWTTEPYYKGTRGGKNYTEMILTLPQAEPKMVQNKQGTYDIFDENGDEFITDVQTKESAERILNDVRKEAAPARYEHPYHWPNISNPLVHIRFNEKTDKDGKRVLFVEELQSDWSQQGGEVGFSREEHAQKVAQAEQKVYEAEMAYSQGVEPGEKGTLAAAWNDAKRSLEELKAAKPVAKAPFVQDAKSYTALAIKRLLRYAADNGYDKISFINGEMAHERFPKTQEGKSTERGMRTHYDTRIPSVAKDVLKKLGAESNVGIEKIKIGKDTKQFYLKFSNGREIGPFRNALETLENLDEAYRGTYGPPVPTEDLLDPVTQEVVHPAGMPLDANDIFTLDRIGYDIYDILANKVEQPLNTKIVSKTEKGNKELFTISLAPETAAKVKEGQALFREERLPRLTKLEAAPNVGQKVSDSIKAVYNSDKSDAWTKFRVAVVDPASGLAKRLSSLPLFSNGQLRADMLHHQYAQVNNIVNNGIQSGVPVLNADGSVIIKDTKDNLARSNDIATSLNNNPNVKSWGGSGMEYVAEIARIMRGKEIMAEDAERRKVAIEAMQSAEKKRKDARKKGVRGAEAIRLNNQAKALEAEYRDDVELNREKQVTPAHIKWAEDQLKAVPQVQEVLDIWRNVNESLIKLREDGGLISKELADTLRKNNSYVPLFAAEEDLEAMRDPNVAISGTGAKAVSQLHKLKGAELTRNIWENLYKQYAITTAAVFQNQVRKIGIEQLASLDAAQITKNAKDPNINVRFRDANSPYADSNGIVNAIVDNPNELAAFQMMHYELTPVMKGMAGATKMLRAGALINPMYWVKQLIRDPLHASIVGGYVVTPADSIREYVNILKGNSDEARILARHGAFGAVDSTVDLQTFLKGIGTEKTTPSNMDKVLHKIMRMHEASDAATRVAIYKKAFADATSRGMSKEEATTYAVMKARESANFSVHGNSQTLNTIRQMIPFFSAAITSLDTVYRAATGYGLNPEEKAKAQRMFYSRAAMMTIMTMAYAMLLQGDEDYQKLPDDVKDANWLMPNPLGEGHSFIRIPVPFEVGFLFKTVPEAAIRYMSDNSTGREVLASYGAGIVQNLPGNGLIIPQAAKPILETMTNHSFFTGRSIESMSDQNLPVSKRGQNASEVAKILSNLGLDKINLSPAKIDNIIQGYTAQLGTFAVNAADAALMAAEGKSAMAKNIEQLPGFKTFMTNPNTSKAVGDFYKLQHEAVEVVHEFNNLKKSGDREGMLAYLADERNKKLIMAEPALRKIQTQLTTISNQMKLIKNNEKLDPEVRLQRVNALMVTYDKVAQQMNKVLKATQLER